MMSVRLAEEYMKVFPSNQLKVPNGIGTWAVGDEGEVLFNGLFFMFIDEVGVIKNGKRKIRGSIFDRYGKSNFQGTLGVGQSSNFISFVKDYEEDARKRMGTGYIDRISYYGFLSENDPEGNLYSGDYYIFGVVPKQRFRKMFYLRLKL